MQAFSNSFGLLLIVIVIIAWLKVIVSANIPGRQTCRRQGVRSVGHMDMGLWGVCLDILV